MKCEALVPFHSFEYEPHTLIAAPRTYFLACTAEPNIVQADGSVEPHIHTVIHPGTGEVHYFPRTPRQEPKDWS